MNARPSRILLRLALCALLVAGGLTAFAGPVSAACERVYVESWDVEVDIPRAVYRVGETARITVTVTRKDTGAPVDGAKFYAALLFEDSIVFDYGRTDAAGGAVADLKLRKGRVETGPARLLVWAEQEVADAECAAVVEYGAKRVPKAFTIKR